MTSLWSKAALSVLFVVLGLILSVVACDRAAPQEALQADERKIAKEQFPVSEIEFVELNLDLDECRRTGGRRCVLAGQIMNKSTQYELTAITVVLYIWAEAEVCCRSQDAAAIDLRIPPDQLQDFRHTFRFQPPLPHLENPRGRLLWRHEIRRTCSNSGLKTLPCSGTWYYPD